MQASRKAPISAIPRRSRSPAPQGLTRPAQRRLRKVEPTALQAAVIRTLTCGYAAGLEFRPVLATISGLGSSSEPGVRGDEVEGVAEVAG